MNPSSRKPAGIGLILLLVLVWSVVVATFAPATAGWHWTLQGLFYLFTGLIWILPLKPLLVWMELGRWRA